MTTKAFFFDNEGQKVSEDKATHAQVLTYDNNGKVVDSVFLLKEGYSLPTVDIIEPPVNRKL